MNNTEVATVNCRLEALENMIKDVVEKVNTLNDKPIQVPSVHFGQPSHVGAGQVLDATVLGQAESAPRQDVRDRSPSVAKRSYNEVARDNLDNQVNTANTFQTVQKAFNIYLAMAVTQLMTCKE